MAAPLNQDRMRPVCTSCGTVVFLDPKVVAGVIAAIGGRVVMVRRNMEPGIGRWTFPAGYVDRGEGVEEAATREMEEESGLKVRITGLVGVYSHAGETNILIVYTGTMVGGTLAAGPEAQEAGLFNPDALPPLAFQRDTAILTDWRRGRGVGPGGWERHDGEAAVDWSGGGARRDEDGESLCGVLSGRRRSKRG